VHVNQVAVDLPSQALMQLVQENKSGADPEVRRIGIDAKQLGAARTEAVLGEGDDGVIPLGHQEVPVITGGSPFGLHGQRIRRVFVLRNSSMNSGSKMSR